MFQYLREKDRILVTGLPRSGTTICAEMIGYDTGHPVLREELLGARMPEQFSRPHVLQAPILLEAALEYKAKGWHVVVVLRDLKECVDSTKRALHELHPKTLPTDLVSSLLKKQEWLRMLCESDMAPMTVRYEDLKLHPLWVSDRRGWKLRQTKHGPNYGAEMGLSAT